MHLRFSYLDHFFMGAGGGGGVTNANDFHKKISEEYYLTSFRPQTKRMIFNKNK